MKFILHIVHCAVEPSVVLTSLSLQTMKLWAVKLINDEMCFTTFSAIVASVFLQKDLFISFFLCKLFFSCI